MTRKVEMAKHSATLTQQHKGQTGGDSRERWIEI